MNYVYAINVTTGGSGYNIGDTAIVDGLQLGGTTLVNDALITIEAVQSVDVVTISERLGDFQIGDIVTNVATNIEWSPDVQYSSGTIVVVSGQPLYYQAIANIPAGFITSNIVNSGSFTIGGVYEIITLGTTDWNTVAGTIGITYAPGDLVVAQTVGDGNGTAIETFVDFSNTEYWTEYLFTPTVGEITNTNITGSNITILRTNNIPFEKILTKPALVTAGNFIINNTYIIVTVGNTDFTLIGASSNTVGARFVATGTGSGNGTAREIIEANCDVVNTTEGIVTAASVTGISSQASKGSTFAGIEASNVIGSGTDAVYGITAPLSTVFDGDSLQFVAPVDMYSNSQEYDKYLVFPKRTILG
jgi:hypothetical protein